MSKQMYSHVSLYSLTLCKVLVSVCDSPEMFFSKVWISFAQFEASTATDESIIQARYVKWLSYILDRERDMVVHLSGKPTVTQRPINL